MADGQPKEHSFTERAQQLPVEVLIRFTTYGLVLYFALSVVLPFLWIAIWAVLIAVMMYPVFDWLRAKTGAERLVAIAVTGVMLFLVLGPIALLCSSLVTSLRQILSGVLSGTYTFPSLPPVIESLPLIGDTLADVWAIGGSNLVDFVEAHAHTFVLPGEWLLSVIASLAGVILTISTAVVLAGLLFIPGRRANGFLHTAMERVAGTQGVRLLGIATATIRSVGRGVVGISLLSALCLGAALVVSRVPHPGILTVLALVFGIVQLGATYIAGSVAVWAWFMRDPSEAIVITAAVVIVAVLEHVLKPIVMGRGLATPTLVLFLGLFGGVAVYGIAGIFIGPIVLSTGWEVMTSWFSSSPPPDIEIEPADPPMAGPDQPSAGTRIEL